MLAAIVCPGMTRAASPLSLASCGVCALQIWWQELGCSIAARSICGECTIAFIAAAEQCCILATCGLAIPDALL